MLFSRTKFKFITATEKAKEETFNKLLIKKTFKIIWVTLKNLSEKGKFGD